MHAFLFVISPVVALLASFLVISVIRFLDVVEPEPWWVIAIGFVLGLATVVPTIVTASWIQLIWSILFGETAPLVFLQLVVDAPLIEETIKALAVVFVLLIFRREMDSLTDFIVYACVVAIAFEFCENTLYLWFHLNAEDGGGLTAWLMEFNARTMASAGVHAMFTAWSGFAIWCLVSGRGVLRWLGSVLGFSLAIALHALNNLAAYMVSLGDGESMSVVYQFGQSLGVIGNILEMAFFLGLIGSAILGDLHVLTTFGLALQQQVLKYSPDRQAIALPRLQCFLNPFHHLMAHSSFGWSLTRSRSRVNVGRAEYARFAKAALSYRAGSDLSSGMALLLP